MSVRPVGSRPVIRQVQTRIEAAQVLYRRQSERLQQRSTGRPQMGIPWMGQHVEIPMGRPPCQYPSSNPRPYMGRPVGSPMGRPSTGRSGELLMGRPPCQYPNSRGKPGGPLMGRPSTGKPGELLMGRPLHLIGQATVETVTYSSEFVVPIYTKAYMFGDNKLV